MMRLVVFAAVLAFAFGAWTGDPRTAQILSSNSDISPEGEYQYAYDTENGISAQEAGIGGRSVQGNNQWTSPEGEVVQNQYVADENGYQPQGSHLPTPPPTPQAILRLLEYLAAHPQSEEPLQQGVRRY